MSLRKESNHWTYKLPLFGGVMIARERVSSASDLTHTVTSIPYPILGTSFIGPAPSGTSGITLRSTVMDAGVPSHTTVGAVFGEMFLRLPIVTSGAESYTSAGTTIPEVSIVGTRKVRIDDASYARANASAPTLVLAVAAVKQSLLDYAIASISFKSMELTK